MNALKQLVLLAVLCGVSYGVYRALYKQGPLEAPPGVDTQWVNPPEVKLGEQITGPGSSTSNSTAGHGPNMLSPAGGNAPKFGGAAVGGNAPPFASIKPSPTTNHDRGAGSGLASPFPAMSSANSGAATNGLNSAAGGSPFSVAMRDVQTRLDSGRLAEALKELSAWINSPQMTPAEDAQLQDLLAQLAGTVVYSREHHLAAAYAVQPGETLEQIAKKHGVTPELLGKINGIDDPTKLNAGEPLKVMRGPFTAIVHLQKRRLILMVDGAYAGSFELAGMGRDAPNLEGEYTVSRKTVRPIYNGPTGEIPSGDPANPLGTLLIALGNECAIYDAEGARATADEPRGSIRLSLADMSELYDILSDGSRVVIRR